jgi:hypothetical protein
MREQRIREYREESTGPADYVLDRFFLTGSAKGGAMCKVPARRITSLTGFS